MLILFFNGERCKLKESVVEGGVPFEKVNGQKTFEYPELDTRFNELFNNAMVHHSTLVIKELLKCYHGFNNVKHLVDVGGGAGVSLNMIISKYPTINGINFDLPHVIQHAMFHPGTCVLPFMILLKTFLYSFIEKLCIKHIEEICFLMFRKVMQFF